MFALTTSTITFLILVFNVGQEPALAKCPFGFGTKNGSEVANKAFEISLNHSHPTVRQRGPVVPDPVILYPHDIFNCTDKRQAFQTDSSFNQIKYEGIAGDVISLYDSYGNITKSRELAACMIRLAGHDALDFITYRGVESGGSDACLNLNDTINEGLVECINSTGIIDVYEKTCDTVSLADFTVISAEAMIYRTSQNFDSSKLFYFGQLGRTFRDKFRHGRRTKTSCTDSIMPKTILGCNDVFAKLVKQVFSPCIGEESLRDSSTNSSDTTDDTNSTDTDRNTTDTDVTPTPRQTATTREDWFTYSDGQTKYDFTNSWQYTTALMGGHTIGGANGTRSGYIGNFTGNASDSGPWTFDNEYYRQMILNGWGPDLNINNSETKHMWKIMDASWDYPDDYKRRLLDSDICLAYEYQPNDGEFLMAMTANSCCAWTEDNVLFETGILRQGTYNDYCGTKIAFQTDTYSQNRQDCCRNQTGRAAGDCNDAASPKGPGFDQIKLFAYSNDDWQDAFVNAWTVATTNGFVEPDFSCKPVTASISREIGAIFVRVSLFLSTLALLLISTA